MLSSVGMPHPQYHLFGPHRSTLNNLNHHSNFQINAVKDDITDYRKKEKIIVYIKSLRNVSSPPKHPF